VGGKTGGESHGESWVGRNSSGNVKKVKKWGWGKNIAAPQRGHRWSRTFTTQAHGKVEKEEFGNNGKQGTARRLKKKGRGRVRESRLRSWKGEGGGQRRRAPCF